MMIRTVFLILLLLLVAAAGLSYAHFYQDRTYAVLGQSAQELRRNLTALRDKAVGWRLPKREMDMLVDGMSRVHATARQLVERTPTHT